MYCTIHNNCNRAVFYNWLVIKLILPTRKSVVVNSFVKTLLILSAVADLIDNFDTKGMISRAAVRVLFWL